MKGIWQIGRLGIYNLDQSFGFAWNGIVLWEREKLNTTDRGSD